MKEKLQPSTEARQLLRKMRRLKPFLLGSFTITRKRCGNHNCACAKKGPLHETALLTWKEKKVTKSIYIPIAQRREVAKWIEEGKRLKQLMQIINQLQRQTLRSMKEKK